VKFALPRQESKDTLIQVGSPTVGAVSVDEVVHLFELEETVDDLPGGLAGAGLGLVGGREAVVDRAEGDVNGAVVGAVDELVQGLAGEVGVGEAGAGSGAALEDLLNDLVGERGSGARCPARVEEGYGTAERGGRGAVRVTGEGRGGVDGGEEGDDVGDGGVEQEAHLRVGEPLGELVVEEEVRGRTWGRGAGGHGLGARGEGSQDVSGDHVGEVRVGTEGEGDVACDPSAAGGDRASAEAWLCGTVDLEKVSEALPDGGSGHAEDRRSCHELVAEDPDFVSGRDGVVHELQPLRGQAGVQDGGLTPL
jgi:hypothetical protein